MTTGNDGVGEEVDLYFTFWDSAGIAVAQGYASGPRQMVNLIPGGTHPSGRWDDWVLLRSNANGI